MMTNLDILSDNRFGLSETADLRGFDIVEAMAALQVEQSSMTVPSNDAALARRVVRVSSIAMTGSIADSVRVPLTIGCRADFNGDGVADFFDYLDFVDALSNGLHSADFNHDGKIDFLDYLDFESALSAGC